MKKILALIIFTLLLNIAYGRYHYHSHSSHHSSHSSSSHSTTPHNFNHSSSHHSTYHPYSSHSSKGYHTYSHGSNNYSLPRNRYYTYPIFLIPTHSPYHGYYHHYHVGSHQDTVFCSNDKHDEPINEDESSVGSSDNEIGGWEVLLIIVGIIALFWLIVSFFN